MRTWPSNRTTRVANPNLRASTKSETTPTRRLSGPAGGSKEPKGEIVAAAEIGMCGRGRGKRGDR